MPIPLAGRPFILLLVLATLALLNGCGLFWFLYGEANDPLDRPFVETSGVSDTPASFSTLASGNPLSGALQVVVVTTGEWDSTMAELRVFERPSLAGEWREVHAGAPCSIGRQGLAWGRGLHRHVSDWGPEKREDDGRAPAGVFSLEGILGAAGDALAGNLGVRMPYTPMGDDMVCITDSDSFRYNMVVEERFYRGELSPRDWDTSLSLGGDAGPVAWAVPIGHNSGMPHPDAGSCAFFLPEGAPAELAGRGIVCPPETLNELVRIMDPAKHPVAVLLPRDVYTMLKPYWTLP